MGPSGPEQTSVPGKTPPEPPKANGFAGIDFAKPASYLAPDMPEILHTAGQPGEAALNLEVIASRLGLTVEQLMQWKDNYRVKPDGLLRFVQEEFGDKHTIFNYPSGTEKREIGKIPEDEVARSLGERLDTRTHNLQTLNLPENPSWEEVETVYSRLKMERESENLGLKHLPQDRVQEIVKRRQNEDDAFNALQREKWLWHYKPSQKEV